MALFVNSNEDDVSMIFHKHNNVRSMLLVKYQDCHEDNIPIIVSMFLEEYQDCNEDNIPIIISDFLKHEARNLLCAKNSEEEMDEEEEDNEFTNYPHEISQVVLQESHNSEPELKECADFEHSDLEGSDEELEIEEVVKISVSPILEAASVPLEIQTEVELSRPTVGTFFSTDSLFYTYEDPFWQFEHKESLIPFLEYHGASQNEQMPNLNDKYLYYFIILNLHLINTYRYYHPFFTLSMGKVNRFSGK